MAAITPSAAIIEILNQGANAYLKSGGSWKSLLDRTGIARAEKIIALTKMPEITHNTDYSLHLLKAVLSTSSSSLNETIMGLFVDHKAFSQQYKNTITLYESRGNSISRKDAILSIIDTNIVENNFDNQKLIYHLNSTEKLNAQLLVV